MTAPQLAGWSWPGGVIYADRTPGGVPFVTFSRSQPEQLVAGDAIRYRNALTAALDFLGALDDHGEQLATTEEIGTVVSVTEEEDGLHAVYQLHDAVPLLEQAHQVGCPLPSRGGSCTCPPVPTVTVDQVRGIGYDCWPGHDR